MSSGTPMSADFFFGCVDFGTASLVVIWVPLGPCRTVGNAFRFALRRRKGQKPARRIFSLISRKWRRLRAKPCEFFRLWRLRDNSHRDARLNVRAPKPRLGVEPKVRDVGWLVPLFCPASTGGTAESTGCGQRVATANGKDPHERDHSRWPHRPVHSRRHALYRSYDRSPRHRRGTGEIEYFTREGCVLAGVEEAARVLGKTGARVIWSRRSGERLVAGEPFLRAEGTAAALHMAWKVSLNLCDHLSGVATKTRAIVDAAHSANSACEVLTTRKSMPGVKDLLTKAVTCGGAFPHRLGASETVLVFDHHITFMGGFEAFLEALPALRGRCVEKKLFVEAGPDEARRLAEAGVDGIQLDKMPVDASGSARARAARDRPSSHAHRGGRHQPAERRSLRRDRRRWPGHHGALHGEAHRHERPHEASRIVARLFPMASRGGV